MCPKRKKNGGTNENTTVDKTDAELFNILLGIKEGKRKERNVHGLLTS
jgi:hypothetical protein